MPSTVLCVDSDRNLCQIVAKALSEQGYRVLSAHDGETAVELLTEDPPDLVLLDLFLPRRDGFGVLEVMRSQDGSAGQTPAVLLSACSPTPEYEARAAAMNAAALLVKPVPLDGLLGLVREQIGEAKAPAEPAGEAEDGLASELAGSLEELPFPALLHHLHGLRATGVLHLARRRTRKWIQLRDGLPVAVRSNLVNECLGNYLLRGGRIDRATLDESLRAVQAGRLQGEILVAMQVLSEEEVAEALRAQADEKLFEIFSWESGSFRFETGGRLQRANVFGVERSPASLILHGVREFLPLQLLQAQLERHRDDFLAPGESPFYRFQEIDLAPEQEALLRGFDEPRRLTDVVDGDEDMQRTVYALLATGLLELRGAERDALPSGVPPQRAERGSSSDAPEEDALRAELAAMAERLSDQSPFEVLGIGPDAAEGEIREAYARLAERTHPDRVGGSSAVIRKLAEEVFGQVTRAYEALVDPRQRQLCVLDQRRTEREAAAREQTRQAREAEALFQKGEAALRVCNYERALEHFQEACELYPDEGEYHAYYGWALHLCDPEDGGKLEEAIKHVRQAIKLASHREKPYLFMGRLCQAAGRTDAAQKLFARAVQIQPQCVEALRELRLLNMRLEKSKGLIGRLFRR
jgi:CheY-like chemotaxis protein